MKVWQRLICSGTKKQGKMIKSTGEKENHNRKLEARGEVKSNGEMEKEKNRAVSNLVSAGDLSKRYPKDKYMEKIIQHIFF